MGRLLGICALLLLSAMPLSAEEFPWCAKFDAFTQNCAFTSYDECAAVAKSAASLATAAGRCIRNPNYQPPAAASARPKAAPAKTANPQR